MPDELGKIRTGRIGRHRMVCRVKVEATQFLRRQLLEQPLGAGSGVKPLLLQLAKINRTSEVLPFEVDFLVAGMAVRLIEDERRCETRVLAARRPGDRTQTQVRLIEARNLPLKCG